MIFFFIFCKCTYKKLKNNAPYSLFYEANIKILSEELSYK
ncbi:hypothetical protein HMPREF0653_02105 [Prevotella disiens JCM 6334 = ATCC 29426]|uniref:Uncharacterized protein n=1 Tax=Prevotella disiens JCM 6334 = ATCC 29426 TaxID=1235811 RepID=A0ABN0NQ81_9BACT|nr:hypothetical protein HMPREF0653_02105 [Prevotella disiens JCM 6334 = ATCC 29426]